VIVADSDNGISAADFVLRSVAKEYSWNHKFGNNLASELMLLVLVNGSSAALRRYDELKKASAGEHLDEATLNSLGYMLLSFGKISDAIAVFQRNVQEFPKSGNVYDSLGEAYMKNGQKGLAIENYEKSLQLDPKNQNAIDTLKKLKEIK
jgi:tetratricopeptide (TPR) repeat protein